MDVFFLLVFLAFLFVMVIGGVLYWAIMAGQFEDTDKNASIILQDRDTESRPNEKGKYRAANNANAGRASRSAKTRP